VTYLLHDVLGRDNDGKPRGGYIYFARSGGFVKIGFAEGDPAGRIAALQCGSPRPLKLVASMTGSRKDEKTLHAALAKHRSSGEWFEAPALRELLAEIGLCPVNKPVTYLLRDVDDGLWQAVKAKAASQGKSIRDVLLEVIGAYLSGRV
jgi:hypothetical protein